MGRKKERFQETVASSLELPGDLVFAEPDFILQSDLSADSDPERESDDKGRESDCFILPGGRDEGGRKDCRDLV